MSAGEGTRSGDGADAPPVAPDLARVERLEAMLASTSDIITALDGDGRIRFSNAAAGRLTGISEEEASGASMLEFVHPDDRDLAAATFAALVAGEEVSSALPLRIRFADGSWHHVEADVSAPVEVNGAPAHVVTVRDVSDRVRADLALEASRQLLETVVADLDEAIVVLAPDLTVSWTSPGIERFVDAPAYTNVGESAFNDMHPDDLPAVVASLERVMGAPGARDDVTFRINHERRGWRTVEATVVNRLDRPGVGGLVCTLRDVTGHADADAELRRLHEQDREEMARLREADRVKDAFLATVSHELRTPLTAVRGLSAFLAENGESAGAQASHLLERIAANAREMEDMVDQLLDYSRLNAGRVQVESVPTVLRDAVEAILERLAGALGRHRVVADVPADLVALADRRALDHVLRNLLTNAARYSPEGSTITVSGSRGTAPKAPGDDPSGPVGGEVGLAVVDEGIGIAPEDQARVFQAFFQASPAATGRRGTGVGLNVARRFAQLQGGRLRLVSTPGEGSTFTLLLPAAPDGDPAAGAPAEG